MWIGKEVDTRGAAGENGGEAASKGGKAQG
jgi:hypothetical protein